MNDIVINIITNTDNLIDNMFLSDGNKHHLTQYNTSEMFKDLLDITIQLSNDKIWIPSRIHYIKELKNSSEYNLVECLQFCNLIKVFVNINPNGFFNQGFYELYNMTLKDFQYMYKNNIDINLMLRRKKLLKIFKK